MLEPYKDSLKPSKQRVGPDVNVLYDDDSGDNSDKDSYDQFASLNSFL